MLEDDIVVETESVLLELDLKNLIQIQKDNVSIMDRSDLRRANSIEIDLR